MFAHIVVHYAKPEHVDDLLASMRQLQAGARGTPGLIDIGPWRRDREDRLLGLAFWESREAYEAARDDIFAIVADLPLDLWLTRPLEGYELAEA